MKRIFKVTALCNYYDNIKTVEVLSWNRGKYCTVKFEDGTEDVVKKYSLYNLPQGFNYHMLPFGSETRITNKEIAEDLKNHKRYFFKLYNFKHKTDLKLRFYKSSDTSYSNLDYEIVGTRSQLIKYLKSLPREKVNNFTLCVAFSTKNTISTFSSCLSFLDNKITVYSFRHKQRDKYIKQLLRSLFKINIKG